MRFCVTVQAKQILAWHIGIEKETWGQPRNCLELIKLQFLKKCCTLLGILKLFRMTVAELHCMSEKREASLNFFFFFLDSYSPS